MIKGLSAAVIVADHVQYRQEKVLSIAVYSSSIIVQLALDWISPAEFQHFSAVVFCSLTLLPTVKCSKHPSFQCCVSHFPLRLPYHSLNYTCTRRFVLQVWFLIRLIILYSMQSCVVGHPPAQIRSVRLVWGDYILAESVVDRNSRRHRTVHVQEILFFKVFKSRRSRYHQSLRVFHLLSAKRLQGFNCRLSQHEFVVCSGRAGCVAQCSLGAKRF